MKTFHYPLNHKADEAYMARMCHQGSVVSALAFAGTVWLAAKVSPWFWALALPVGGYAVMCVCLGVSYTRLIRRLRGKRP